MTIERPPAASMTPYFLQFCFGLLVLSAIAVTIAFYFGIEDSGATGVFIMFAVAAVVGSGFARREGRAMTWRESSKLATLGTLFNFVFGLLEFAAIFMLLSGWSLGNLGLMLASMNFPMQTLIMIVMAGLALSWIAIFIASCIFSRLAARLQQKKVA